MNLPNVEVLRRPTHLGEDNVLQRLCLFKQGTVQMRIARNQVLSFVRSHHKQELKAHAL
jgi:hypothetical protein